MKSRSKVGGLIFIILAIFILGLVIGGQPTIGSSNYFETTKQEFENDIVNPENAYNPQGVMPKGNITTDVALKIDDGLSTVISKILEKLASLFA